MKDILLLNDMPGHGKVALSAAIPILSRMGYQVYNLPTALVSNTLDYGRFRILDTTDYMRDSMEVWDRLGFRFDAVCTGFLVSEEQAELVADYCARKKAEGAFIFVDPIMGDAGRLYNGVTMGTVEIMRRMCRVADAVVPNATEAAFLAGKYTDRTDLRREEAEDLLRTLHGLGAGSAVITSMQVEGQRCTMLLDGENTAAQFPYAEIPGRFPGTGDIFSSLVLGCYGRGRSMADSVGAAVGAVEELIAADRDNGGGYKGIPVEQYMDVIPSLLDCVQRGRYRAGETQSRVSGSGASS